MDNMDDITGINVNKLYNIKTYTDTETGEIRQYIAISQTGELSTDENHQDFFMGMTNIETPQGIMPITFDLEGAKTLKDAIELFPDFANQKLEEVQREIEEMIEKEMDRHRIITPDDMRGKNEGIIT